MEYYANEVMHFEGISYNRAFQVNQRTIDIDLKWA